MNRQGRSAAEERALRAALVRSRQVRTRVTSLTLAGEPVEDLSDLFLDGQVNVHAHRRVSRTVLLALTDPGQLLPFDSDGPAAGSLDFRRQLQVEYGVLVGGDWVWTDVFTGPVAFLRRRSGLAYVEGHGKERLAMAASWRTLTIPARTAKTDAIREILADRGGETFFDIPDLPARLARPISLGRATSPWRMARLIAASMGMQLFYNGSGVCTLRYRPDTVGFTFTDDEHVKPPGPRIDYSGDDVVNAVYVFGAPPAGGKTQVSWPAVAPRDHPLSPWELGRNDVPNYRARFVHDDTIHTVAEAKVRARRELRDALVQHVRVRFESQPVGFFLDPLDLCRVDSAVSVEFRLNRYSFPLAAGPEIGKPMTVGYLDDLMVDRSARR